MKKKSSKQKLNKENPTELVVNGPWVISDHLENVYLQLSPNPLYHKKNKKGDSLPYLKKISVFQEEKYQERLKRFLSGTTDLFAASSADVDYLLQVAKRSADTKNPFEVYDLGPSTMSLFITFNLSTAKSPKGTTVVSPHKTRWFRNAGFRQAIAHAIDKDFIIRKYYGGKATPQISHMSPQSSFFNPNLDSYGYDLKKSKKLLKTSGFVKDGDLLRDSYGNLVEFDLITNNDNDLRVALGEYMSTQLRKLGIVVHHQPESFKSLANKASQTLKWESMIMGLNGSAFEPHDEINVWSTAGTLHLFNKGASENWIGEPTSHMEWEMDVADIYNKASTEFDTEKRKQLYFKSQQIISEKLPFIFTVSPNSYIAVSKKFGNILPFGKVGKGLNAALWNSEYIYQKR